MPSQFASLYLKYLLNILSFYLGINGRKYDYINEDCVCWNYSNRKKDSIQGHLFSEAVISFLINVISNLVKSTRTHWSVLYDNALDDQKLGRNWATVTSGNRKCPAAQLYVSFSRNRHKPCKKWSDTMAKYCGQWLRTFTPWKIKVNCSLDTCCQNCCQFVTIAGWYWSFSWNLYPNWHKMAHGCLIASHNNFHFDNTIIYCPHVTSKGVWTRSLFCQNKS